MDWDTTIALAYAAEQLCIAAQALTSDTVPTERGLRIAETRLSALLDNDIYLPNSIRTRVRKLYDQYLRQRAAARDPESAQALSDQTMSALDDIRGVLAGIEQGRLAA